MTIRTIKTIRTIRTNKTIRIKTDRTNKTIRIKTDRTNKTIRAIRHFVRDHLNRLKVLTVFRSKKSNKTCICS